MVGVVNTPELQVGDMAWPRTAYPPSLSCLLLALAAVVSLPIAVLAVLMALHGAGAEQVLVVLFAEAGKAELHGVASRCAAWLVST
jgi:hypothetical protein